MDVLCVAITERHFLIWKSPVRQFATRWYRGDFMLKYAFWWLTRQGIHTTLIVVDQYLWFMGDEMILDSVEFRMESCYPPFVAAIDLAHHV